MQRVAVEDAFKSLKSDLGFRPIHHPIEPGVEAPILVAFLGDGLTVALRRKLRRAASGLTPREVVKSLGALHRLEVAIAFRDGRELVLPRQRDPEAEQPMILEKLGLKLPAQPPPRIRQPAVVLPAAEMKGVL